MVPVDSGHVMAAGETLNLALSHKNTFPLSVVSDCMVKLGVCQPPEDPVALGAQRCHLFFQLSKISPEWLHGFTLPRILATLGLFAGALVWLWLAEGRKPDTWDLTGGVVVLLGAAIILWAPRAG